MTNNKNTSFATTSNFLEQIQLFSCFRNRYNKKKKKKNLVRKHFKINFIRMKIYSDD